MKRVIIASASYKLRNIIEQVEIYSKCDKCSIEEAIEIVADKFNLSNEVVDYLFERFGLHK